MNVKELIDKLSKMPKDLPVFAYTKDDICSEVTDASLAIEDAGLAHEWDKDDIDPCDPDYNSKPNAVTLSLEYN